MLSRWGDVGENIANLSWSTISINHSKLLRVLWGALVITDSTERLYPVLLYYYSPEVFQEIHTGKTTTTTWDCVVHSHFSAVSLFKVPQKPSYQMLYQAEIFWTNHKKYFVTKLSDWWVTPKHDLSNCFWTSPSKLLSTQLFRTRVILLVQMSLLLKILLHPTHLFLEGNVMEPIWNSVWRVYLSQALPLFCSILPSSLWVHQNNIFLQQSMWITIACTRTRYLEKLINEKPCCKLLTPWC